MRYCHTRIAWCRRRHVNVNGCSTLLKCLIMVCWRLTFYSCFFYFVRKNIHFCNCACSWRSEVRICAVMRNNYVQKLTWLLSSTNADASIKLVCIPNFGHAWRGPSWSHLPTFLRLSHHDDADLRLLRTFTHFLSLLCYIAKNMYIQKRSGSC